MSPIEDYQEEYDGDAVLVLGTGPSLELARRLDWWEWTRRTIGSNLVNARGYLATYVVCLEPLSDIEFWDKIGAAHSDTDATLITLPEIAAHRGRGIVIPTAHPVGWPGPHGLQVKAQLVTSTWVAAAVAVYMGAAKVGVLGVDLVGHPILGRPWERQAVNDDWAALAAVSPVPIVNLSPGGALEALPRERLAEF